MKEKFILPKKSELVQIKINDINYDLPDLKNVFESKALAAAKWLKNRIETDFTAGRIKENMLLPNKADIAYMLGVSIGTVQNSLRYLEDLGYVESKQCIGTIIKDWRKNTAKMRKLTSKREIAINKIKKYILNNKFKINQQIPSSRVIASNIDCSANTTRLALEYLCAAGILQHKFKNSKETGWIVKTTDFKVTENETQTLVNKVEEDLKAYITKNLRIGEKLPAHSELSKELKVSIKTIHDALKSLINNGILLARRGRYGTTVIKMPYDTNADVKKETSIFAPAQDTAFYFYEKTQRHIKNMIAEKYEIGSKLPSIIELSKEMDLSPNTIRKAFHNLAREGYLVFSRGRYGGTFVIDIPETDAQAFKWLAVNPKYAEVYNN